MNKDKEEIIETLSPIERKVLPHLKEDISIKELEKKSGLEETAVMRALQFLENKKIVNLTSEKKKIVDLGDNGVVYLKNELPERRLLNLLAEKKEIKLEDKPGKLSDNEFKAAIGALKKKAMIETKEGKIILVATIAEIGKKMLEEQFLEILPIEISSLKPEQLYALKALESRKDIITVEEKKEIKLKLTDLGKEIIKKDLSNAEKLLENLTPEIIKTESWKGKKFRRYDISSSVPVIYGGKRQPYYYFLQEVRDKLIGMGFKEMTGSTLVSEFWNFDALFQPQFHAARDWSDTYIIKGLKAALPNENIVQKVKKIHEEKWKYKWDKEKARQIILRPQGTVLSAQTLAKEREGKFFAIARTYRPDIVDAKHLSEFNQVEGIIIGKNLNFPNLLHTLKTFAIKIANAKPENIRFRPSYFPFTEPSVEMDVKHEKLGWIEIGGAGIFRKEVTEPLTGIKDKDLRVLAWGLGIDRLAMLNLGINDIRELFSSNLEFLRAEKI